MEDNTGWVQLRQSGIGYDELTSMIAELVSHFENGQSTENAHLPDWISPSSCTRVIRHGSSSSLFSVLNQVPSAVSAEYEVVYRGVQVFTWSEYLWPQLHEAEAGHKCSRTVYLPKSCLKELMDFHVQNKTQWLYRYQAHLRRDRAIKINKIGVVTQANRVELG